MLRKLTMSHLVVINSAARMLVRRVMPGARDARMLAYSAGYTLALATLTLKAVTGIRESGDRRLENTCESVLRLVPGFSHEISEDEFYLDIDQSQLPIISCPQD